MYILVMGDGMYRWERLWRLHVESRFLVKGIVEGWVVRYAGLQKER